MQFRTKTVVHGHRNADSIGRRVAQRLSNKEAVVQDVVMRKRHALKQINKYGQIQNIFKKYRQVPA
jgi:hypothetical protein